MKTGFIFLAKECYFLILFLMLVPVWGIGPIMEKELTDGSSSAFLVAVWFQGPYLNKYGRRYLPKNSCGENSGKLACLFQWGGRQQKSAHYNVLWQRAPLKRVWFIENEILQASQLLMVATPYLPAESREGHSLVSNLAFQAELSGDSKSKPWFWQ